MDRKPQTETLTWLPYPENKPKDTLDKTFLANWDNGEQVVESYYLREEDIFLDVDDYCLIPLDCVIAFAEMPKGYK